MHDPSCGAAVPVFSSPDIQTAGPDTLEPFVKPCPVYRQRVCADIREIRTSQSGFNLVEVMVSLVILSMSLLGLLALQGVGTQYGNKSYFMTQAMLQSYDILDRMRANSTAAMDGAYNQNPIPKDYALDCSHNVCSTQQLADYELVTWNTQNATLLPQGSGLIKRAGNLFTVEITWREWDSAEGSAEYRNHTLSARL